MAKEPEDGEQDFGRRGRKTVTVMVVGTIVLVALFAGLVVAINTGYFDEQLSDYEATNEGPYRIDDAKQLCGDIDWSVLDDAYELEGSSWRDDVERRGSHHGNDNGTGGFGCAAVLPVAGVIVDDPVLKVGIAIEPTVDKARESFDSESEVMLSGEGSQNWNPLSIDKPERCDDVLSGVRELSADGERGYSQRQLNIGCLSGNAVVSVRMTGFDADDGTGRDTAAVVREVTLPVMDRVFAVMSKT